MSCYFKFVILAFLVLNASATINADAQSTKNNMMEKELLIAEIKALLAMKQVEQAMMLGSPLKRCLPLGQPCDPNLNLPTQCCTKFCAFSAWHRGFVCTTRPTTE